MLRESACLVTALERDGHGGRGEEVFSMAVARCFGRGAQEPTSPFHDVVIGAPPAVLLTATASLLQPTCDRAMGNDRKRERSGD